MRAGPRRALGRPRLAAMAAALLVVPSAAFAHVQVTPTIAAPDDAVEFTVLVPNERDQQTTRVELQNPPGMLPFAFADVPGWKRDVIEAADGSIDRIVWTGSLARDGFVKFSFLAGTPEQAGRRDLEGAADLLRRRRRPLDRRSGIGQPRRRDAPCDRRAEAERGRRERRRRAVGDDRTDDDVRRVLAAAATVPGRSGRRRAGGGHGSHRGRDDRPPARGGRRAGARPGGRDRGDIGRRRTGEAPTA